MSMRNQLLPHVPDRVLNAGFERFIDGHRGITTGILAVLSMAIGLVGFILSMEILR